MFDTDKEKKERKERMKEYRRRYEEKHGVSHRHYNWQKGLILAALVCLAGAGGFVYAQSRTAQNVLLDGQSVSTMSEEDVQAYLDKKEKELRRKSIKLSSDGEDVLERMSLSRMDCTVDRDRVYNSLYLTGRTGSPFHRVYDVYSTLRYGKNVPVSLKADDEKLDKYITQVHDTYDVPEQNAYAVPNSDMTVSIQKEQDRITIDSEALKNMITEELAQGSTEDLNVPITDRKEAAIKKSDLKGIDTVLSYYTTHFDGTNPDRNKNIELSQELLTHSYVPAGQAFSFNTTVGTRTKEKGYKDAPVYYDNKVVMDAGGGVCQTSTTLFNAALRAGLIIDHRAPHFAPAGYVPVGMDATVADNSLDFGFTNPFKHPVYIYTKYTNDSLTVYILGNKADTCKVTFKTLSQKTLPHKVIHKHDDSVTDDVRKQEGYDGHDISIRRDVLYKDGDKYHDTITSHYDPNTTIILTKGENSEETVQATNLDGEQSQDVMLNLLHDPMAPVVMDGGASAGSDDSSSDT